MTENQKPQRVIENRIHITASPEVTWACFTDLSKWTNWFPALTQVAWASGNPWTLKAQGMQTFNLKFPCGEVQAVGTIIEINPTQFVAWEGQIMGIDATWGLKFQPTADGTEVLVRHEFYGTPVFFSRLIRFPQRIRQIYSAALERFKQYVETGNIQLAIPL